MNGKGETRMEVYIDGVKYVPLRSVVINYDELARKLPSESIIVEHLTKEQFEEELDSIRMEVSDSFPCDEYHPTIREFLDKLVE
jgi:hypothetical protein